MSAGAYVGRVGGLAVALGVGAALFTGSGVAWADTPSSSDSSSTDSSPASAHDEKPGAEKPDAEKPDATKPDSQQPDTTKPEPEAGADEAADPDPVDPEPSDPADPADPAEPAKPVTESKKSAATTEESAASTTPTTKVSATEVKVDESKHLESKPTAESESTEQSALTASPRAMAASVEVQAAATSVAVPSLRPWPTAFDPGTAVSYLTGLVTSVVSAVLNPFAAGLPAGPAAPPTAWTLLAWVRRELFNESPTITPVINPQSNGLVTGNIGAVDPDGDPLTYTVVGTPHNGGTLEIDDAGNFTYRPMNAMAAVGGVDQFTVVVSDEAAGLHVHGPLGLLKFVPILGNFINPGAGDAVAQTITVNVDPVAGVDLSFPASFHWGVAHAGFQAEGGPGSPVDPNSDWYKWVHDPINQLLGLTHGVPEDGPGTYVSYDTDAVLAETDLGMNTFRMSIEWSRIFPNSTASIDISDEGGGVSQADLEALDALANSAEVQHYRDVFASLRAHDLEPLITVNHFTLPAWVHDPTTTRLLAQLGLPAPDAGWLSPDTPVEFEKYAAYVAWKYGDQVDNWTVLNEPVPPVLTEFLSIPGVVPAWPPGLIRPDLASTFLVNEAKGYVAAYDAIHEWDQHIATPGQPKAFVGFANNMIPARPANPVNPLDVQAADAWNDFYNHWFPNAVIDGWVDANLDGIQTADEIHPEFMNKADFIGVQYYGSQPMQGFGFAPVPGFPWLKGLPGRCAASEPTCSDFNQPTDPGGFREVLEVAASYGKPLWVTENGIADANDSKRPSYLVNHIAVVQDMVAHGVDIRGYTYWSFVDNLEWANGYDLEFGLYGSDPTTPELERTPKPASIAAISGITTSNSLPLALLGMYIPNL
ncbi:MULTISPECIES: family 1 glycosylhydrolase [unclassified Mycobacterium]|uniref:family 1 glycosylhydrolase n=1 Tax=unclassified Mycobacterium TaxID=2642494 RepID=UPI0029C6D5E2|nr:MULTISPECIES: family 1 glycosylhydrolase [unclassified Mycobacterium]